MAFARSYRLIEATVATLATAALFYFGNGLEPRWPLVWFAPLPVLLLALRSRWWTAGAAAVAATLLGGLNMWSYLTKTLGAPEIAWAAVFLIAGAFFAAGVLTFRMLVLRGSLWSGLAALPAAWVTGEFVRNLATPHGSAGSLAYSQLKFLPFLQLASITGPWGMSFVLLLFPAAIAIGLHLRRQSPKRALWVAGTGTAVVVAVLLFGAMRLGFSQGTSQAQSVPVGLVATDENADGAVADPGAATERLWRSYARQAKTLAAGGAQAIIMPEKLGVMIEGRAAETDAILQSVADRTGATIIAGVVDVDGKTKYNQARIYIPGSALQRYDKEHMLPPFESNLKPGTTLTILPRPQQKWGVAICKDMDFASPSRRYGAAAAGLMLVPAWDFVVDAGWHGHIAVMRGVENGFSVARAARNGFLTVSDNRGRILGEIRSGSGPFATLLIRVPSVHVGTVYQLMGDWFAWVALALLILAVVQTIRLRQAEQLGLRPMSAKAPIEVAVIDHAEKPSAN